MFGSKTEQEQEVEPKKLLALAFTTKDGETTESDWEEYSDELLDQYRDTVESLGDPAVNSFVFNLDGVYTSLLASEVQTIQLLEGEE